MSKTTIEAAGWIVHTDEAIYGSGLTLEAAIAESRNYLDAEVIEELEESGDLLDSTPASASLLSQVAGEGGAIAWDIVNGVACRPDEADVS